jgi:APA family basic amino acid/polyamine antiporter
MWAYDGFADLTFASGEVKDPQRNLPRATLLGSAIAIVATVVSCTVVGAIVPGAELATSEAPFALAASRLWGNVAGLVFAATAAIACFGALNGWVLMQGQLPLAAARDGVFPSLFARVDARGTPQHGLVIGSVLASLLVLANYQKDLVGLFTFSILLATASCLLPYVVCSIAAMRTRETGDRVVALFAFLFSIAALVGSGAEALLWGAALVVAGCPVYLLQRRRLAINRSATSG